METCEEIAANLARDCDNPLQGGTEADVYLFNRHDIASFTRDGTNSNIIRAIGMKASKKGFKYEGYNQSLKPKVTGKKKAFSYKWKHELDFLILQYNSTVKSEVEKLSISEILAIVVNKSKTNDAAVEIYGISNGLILKDGAIRDLVDTNTEGAFSLGLETREGDEEPHLPASFAVLETSVYSYSATITALDALITADA